MSDGTAPSSENAATSALVSPPGTSIGAGFVVVEGTSLVADPIPIATALVRDGQPVVDGGWVATSIIGEAEPTSIVDDYLAQAEAGGLTDQVRAECGLDREVAICEAFARTPDRGDARSVAITVIRGQRGDVYSNHVVVRYSTTDLFWEYGRDIVELESATEPPAPQEWPPQPQVGEPIGTADELLHDIVVQEGSRLAGPVRLNVDDATGGLVAILEVTGHPQAVLQSYLDALGESFGTDLTPTVVEVGDATITEANASEAGGDHLQFTMVERAGRPTWLRIDGSHD